MPCWCHQASVDVCGSCSGSKRGQVSSCAESVAGVCSTLSPHDARCKFYVDGRRRWTSGGGGREEAVDVRRRWTSGGGGRQEAVDGRRRWKSGGCGREEVVDFRR
ncbi:hypothetical protein LSAT2_017650, partial [Lamellibrachia satsuma]